MRPPGSPVSGWVSVPAAPIPTHAQAPPSRAWGRAPPTRVPSFRARAVVSLKSTLPQVRKAVHHLSRQQPRPSALHQLGQSLPSQEEPSPHSSRDTGACPLMGPWLSGVAALPVALRPSCLRSPQSTGLVWTPGQPERPSLCALPSRVSGGWLLCGAFSISFACGSLNINMHKNPPPCLLLFEGLLGVRLMGVCAPLYVCGAVRLQKSGCVFMGVV